MDATIRSLQSYRRLRVFYGIIQNSVEGDEIERDKALHQSFRQVIDPTPPVDDLFGEFPAHKRGVHQK